MLIPIRHISWLAIISSVAGSVLMLIIGAVKTYKGIELFLSPNGEMGQNVADAATAYLIKSIDAFLIAFVLMIFAYGVYKLFINAHTLTDKTLDWIVVKNISHLKKILAELIIIIVFVKFLEVVLLNLNSLQWDVLILPLSIVLLSIALKLLDLDNN